MSKEQLTLSAEIYQKLYGYNVDKMGKPICVDGVYSTDAPNIFTSPVEREKLADALIKKGVVYIGEHIHSAGNYVDVEILLTHHGSQYGKADTRSEAWYEAIKQALPYILEEL